VTGEHLTDLGNARRLVAHAEGLIHFDHILRKWWAWDERRWPLDETGQVERLAKEAVAKIYAEAAQSPSDEDRKAIAKWAQRSESRDRIRAMIDLAASEPGVPIRTEELDQDPWLLTTLNGTVGLRDGKLRGHDPEDLLTRLVPTEFKPDVRSELWERALERVLPDPEVRAFIQRAVGYSLTGEIGEQVLFLLWGAGANGKTTFIETLLGLLGDFAVKTPAETLLAKRDTGIPNDVAKLRGARFIAAVEAEEGRRLAEARVKELTGGDTVAARFMRGEWFTFRLQGKLWLASNHRPVVRGTDHAMWRRIRLIPFTVTIPEEERDPHLGEKLRAEHVGILSWAVEGCLAWQRDGLCAPEAVRVATDDYRAEQDVLGGFLSESCVVGEAFRVASADLYRAYKAWCDSSGEKPIRQRDLGLRLRERGFRPDREGKSRERGWLGLGLRATWADAEGPLTADGRRFPYNQNHSAHESENHETVSASGQCPPPEQDDWSKGVM